MRVSDEHHFFFVHIPKCAGRSIGKALEPVVRFPEREMAEDLGLSETEMRCHLDALRFEHPILGALDPYHIPLPAVKEHFPRTFELIENNASFAVVREPRDRFLSALTQRMKEYLGYTSFRLEDPVVLDEAKAVCSWLEGRTVFTDMEYAHFTRQIDYVEVDGQRIVDQVFSMKDMPSVEKWLSAKGFEPEIEYGFDRRQPKAWFKAIHPVTRAAASALPKSARKLIYPIWIKSGLFAPAAAQYNSVQFDDDIESFIQEFYARDRELWESAQQDSLSAASSQ